jgi:putative PEP-CTERM system TPR-repeat lipoprotein
MNTIGECSTFHARRAGNQTRSYAGQVFACTGTAIKVSRYRFCKATAHILALSFLLGIIGCTKSGPDANQLFQDAQRFYAQGNRNAAIIQLKNALSQDPKNVAARLFFGKCYLENGELPEAERQFRMAIELGGDKSTILPLLARALLEKENYRGVLEVGREPELNPESAAELIVLAGRAHMGLGEYPQAKLDFQKALPEKPVDAELGLAQVAAAGGDIASAQKMVEQILAKAPASAPAWILKGDLLVMQSQPDQGLVAYQQASRVQPDYAPAYLAQALLYVDSAKYPAARDAIENARKYAPASPRLNFAQAVLSLQEGKYDACRTALQRVFAVIPEHAPSMLVAATLNYSTGETQQAQKLYSEYLAKFPKSLYARKMLAATWLRSAQPQSALYVLQPILEGSKDSQSLALAGEAYLQLGQSERAIPFLERSVALDPGDSGKLTSLGASRLVAGDTARALNELEAAINLDPGNVRAANLLIMTMIGRNELDKAMQAALVLEKSAPNNPVSYSLKAAVHFAKHDIAGARSSLEHALSLQPSYFPAAAALAQMDLADNKPEAARKRIASILDKDKTNLDAMVALAGISLGEGQRDEAVRWLKRAVSENPQAVQPYVLLAQLYLQANQSSEALGTAQAARGLSFSDPQVLEVLGAAQLATNDKDGAIQTFSSLVAALPRSVAARLKLASAYSANGDYPAAIAMAKEALKREPNNPDAQLALAYAYLRAKRYTDAMEIARRLRQQYPGAAQGYGLEGDVQMAQKKYALAAQSYEQALSRQKTARVLTGLHSAQSLAKLEASEKPLVDWLRDNPTSIEAREYLAGVYLDSGRQKDAIDQYKILLKSDPKSLPALNNLAWMLQDKNANEALDYAQRAFQIKPEDAAIADTLGWLLIKKRDLSHGVEMLQKAVSLDPDNPEIRYHLATAFHEQGDNDRARKELEIVLASGKKFPKIEEARSLLTNIAK